MRVDVVTLCCQETESARVPACLPPPARGTRVLAGPWTRGPPTPQHPHLPPGDGGAQQDRGMARSFLSNKFLGLNINISAICLKEGWSIRLYSVFET